MPNEREPLTAKEKLELVLLSLAKEEAVTTICEEAGVSRPLFYRWIKEVRRALWEALEAKKRGRKARILLESPRKAEALQTRLIELEREVAALRKERDRYKLVTEVAQRLVRRKMGPQRGPGGARRGRPKKSATIDARTPSTGPSSAPSAFPPRPSPPPGESIAPPTGAGSTPGPQAPASPAGQGLSQS